MDQIEKELRAFINDWRERHDLKPSEVVECLRNALEHYRPLVGTQSSVR